MTFYAMQNTKLNCKHTTDNCLKRLRRYTHHHTSSYDNNNTKIINNSNTANYVLNAKEQFCSH